MKTLLKSIAALLILLIVGGLAFVFLVDANSFKPRIEAMAKEQGIVLQIKGDLGWDLWPRLGVAVNDVSVAALTAPAQPIAELKQASLMLAIKPLFAGEFQVDHLVVNGADIYLQVDAAGKGNWEALTRSNSTASAAPPPAPSEANLKLDIQRLSLNDSQIHYRNTQTGQTINLRDINLGMDDLNTRAQPFALRLSLVMELMQAGADKMVLEVALNNMLSVDAELANVTVNDGSLQLDIIGKESAAMTLDYALTINNLQQDLNYQGHIKLSEMNGRKVLAAVGSPLDTANSAALSKVAFASPLQGDSKKISFDKVELIIDDTVLNGTIALTDFTTSAVKIMLDGNAINVDDYLPPPSETTAQAAAPADDTPLPLESLRGLNINAALALKKVIVNKMVLENVALKVQAKNGMIEPTFTATAYSGAINAKGQLDARSEKAKVQFDAGVTGLELAPLLKAMEMDSKFGLQGAVQAHALGSSRGKSVNQLFTALQSTATFSGAQVRATPINLEQQFCKLVNLVNKAEDPATAWAAYTEMSELAGSITLRDQLVTIDTFKAGVEKLQLGSRGKINLATDEYDIFLPFKLIKTNSDTVTNEQVAVSTSANGCSIGSQYWLERGLELLHCKGSFAEINPLTDCRPDKTMLVELTKDYAVYKLKEKHGVKLEEKKVELKEKVEKEKSKLFDKLQQRLIKETKPAAVETSAPAADESAVEPANLPVSNTEEASSSIAP